MVATVYGVTLIARGDGGGGCLYYILPLSQAASSIGHMQNCKAAVWSSIILTEVEVLIHMEPDRLELVYVPCGSEDEAVAIAARLVSEGLIACGNIVESRSIYMWEGALMDQKEYLLLAKTTKSRSGAARKRVAQLHSYDIPCIIALAPQSVNPAYERWVRGEVLTGNHPQRLGSREEG